MDEFTRAVKDLSGLSADTVTIPAGVSPANPNAGTTDWASQKTNVLPKDVLELITRNGISTNVKIALVVGALAVMAGYFFFIKRKG